MRTLKRITTSTRKAAAATARALGRVIGLRELHFYGGLALVGTATPDPWGWVAAGAVLAAVGLLSGQTNHGGE